MSYSAPVREPEIGGSPAITMILQALEQLDARLSTAADAVKLLFGPESSRDLFRGLHITPSDVDVALHRPPVSPLFGPLGFSAPLLSPEELAGTRFEGLRRAFDLSAFDLDVVVVLLAPEIDGRYERLYAFIQDDVAKKRPSLDLVLNLLSSSIEDKIAALRRFEADAPLVRHGLIRLGAGEGHLDTPRLARPLAIDETVVSHLLAQPALDGRIAPYCRLIPPGPAVSRSPGRRRAPADDLDGEGVFYLRGVDQQEILASVCEGTGATVLAFDADWALSSGTDWDALITVVLRSARLGAQVLFIHAHQRLWDVDQQERLRQLLARLADHPGPVYLSGPPPWRSTTDGGACVVPIDVEAVDPGGRTRFWRDELARKGIRASPAVVAEAATTFDLTHAQVANAVRYALHRARRRGDRLPSRDDLFQGARLQTRSALLGLADRFEVHATWDDLVLPPETVAHLREIALRVARRSTVLGDWGFGRRRSYGTGTAVVFGGPSGTGKTFAAAVLASEIGLDLHRIDLSSVVSKYIGETEKNLARVFAAAERANCILLFDEAEALFGKRSEVRDAHDRYANQELAYLLQRIEQFDGMAILTTNMPGAMDEAFRRRLAATVYFPLPDESARRRLWERAWPSDTRLAPDIDIEILASRFQISGGTIAQAALGAAYLAADNGPPIAMRHVLHALRRELEALGQPVPRIVEPTSLSVGQ